MRLGWMLVPALAVAAYPADADRGQNLIEARDYTTAETEMKQQLAGDADNAAAHRYLGVAEMHLGKTDEAVKHLKRAVELEPESGDARIALAAALIEARQFAEAEANIREGAAKSEDHPDLPYTRGALLVVQKQFKESIPHLEKAIERNKENALAHYYLALAYSNQKRPDKTITHFEQFLRLEPDSPNAAKVRSFLRNIR